MTRPIRVGDLEVAQDLAFERRALRVRRVGNVLWGLVIAAALAGLLGDGPLNDAVARDGRRAIEGAYERVVHRGAPTEVRIRVVGDPSGRRLEIARDYFDGYTLEGIVPEPEQASARQDALVLAFAPRLPSELVLQLEARRAGRLRGWVRTAGGAPAGFSQVAMP